MFLGVWLVASPITFGYAEIFLGKNDVVCGLILLICGWRSRRQGRFLSIWLICLLGIWLQIAPLFFWTQNAAAYLNDTFSGVLIILFSVIIPGIPNHQEREGYEIPPGWSYNPSSWPQRIPVIALACFGWLGARYLDAYQMGFITTMWEPWFGDGTVRVITSSVSQSFPVPDAGLGAFAYTLEVLMGCKGGTARWRTMPWLVLGFGLLVIPLGLVSILLIILQPLIVGAWCGLCLMIASGMLIMVMLTVDEVTASLQCLRQGRRAGISWRSLLWEGLPEAKPIPDKRTPPLTASFHHLLIAAFWGCRLRWNLIFTALVGVGVMMLPAWLALPKPLADSDHILGALSIVISVVAMADVTKKVRFGLLVFGAFLLAGGIAYLHDPLIACIHFSIGCAWGLLCWPEGKVLESYGKAAQK